MRCTRPNWRQISITIVAGVLVLSQASRLAAQDRRIEHAHERASGTNISSVKYSFELGVGEINISPMSAPDSAGNYATADVDYTPRYYRYAWDAHQVGSVAQLDIKGESRHNSGFSDHDRTNWDIFLSRALPCDLDLELGAADAIIDLGGLRLTDLELDIGAANAEVTFKEPNPVACRSFMLKSGAASVKVESLANLGAKEATIEIGAAKLRLDLGGKQRGETTIDLSVGVGSCDIMAPENLPLRVEGADEHWFASIDIPRHHLHRVRSGVYETETYEGAADRVMIDLSVGMGSVNFKFR